MQSPRPPHHAHHSRSLFQNRWTPAEATPNTSTTSTYWPAFSAGLNLSTISTFLTNPSISLVRVRNSEIHPHPPVKVVKPDWGHSASTAGSSQPPDVRATWLGHAVRVAEPTRARCSNSTRSDAPPFLFFFFRVSSSSFRVP